jgi:HAD superfamily hydrolase (TIGR01509 family)
MPEYDFVVIFDQDGVLVENNKFNKIAWQQFCKKHGLHPTEQEYKEKVYGRINADTLKFLFGDGITQEQIVAYSEEKESIFREAMKGNIKPVRGLIELMDSLKGSGIKMALATSAPPENIEFVLSTINARKYFDVIVDETMVEKGKPNPDVYFKTAKKCNVNPSKCIVFEDSISGIKSVLAAGMKVIAITTTHNKDELKEADLVIDDFTQVTKDSLLELF